MGTPHSMSDLSDPAARAALQLARAQAGDRILRIAGALAAGAIAAAAMATAGPLTGEDGAWVGAIVLAGALLAVAAAVWPHAWSDAERRHHELDAIWRTIRSDGDVAAAYTLYLPWATSTGTAVELSLIERRPVERHAGAPSPYVMKIVERLDPEDVLMGAEKMERLRSDAQARELEARQAHHESLIAAELAAHRRVLSSIDREAASYQREREHELRRELAAQAAADRAAQAEALARALRKP